MSITVSIKDDDIAKALDYISKEMLLNRSRLAQQIIEKYLIVEYRSYIRQWLKNRNLNYDKTTVDGVIRNQLFLNADGEDIRNVGSIIVKMLNDNK